MHTARATYFFVSTSTYVCRVETCVWRVFFSIISIAHALRLAFGGRVYSSCVLKLGHYIAGRRADWLSALWKINIRETLHRRPYMMK